MINGHRGTAHDQLEIWDVCPSNDLYSYGGLGEVRSIMSIPSTGTCMYLNYNTLIHVSWIYSTYMHKLTL